MCMLQAMYHFRLNRYEIRFHDVLIGFAKLNFSSSHCNVAIEDGYCRFFHKGISKITACATPSARIAPVAILIRVCRYTFILNKKKTLIDFPAFELDDVTYADARFRVDVGNYFLLSCFRVRLRSDRNFSGRWIFIVRQRNFINERKTRGVVHNTRFVIIIFDERNSRHFLNKKKKWKGSSDSSLTIYIYKISRSHKAIYLGGIVRSCFSRCFMRSIRRSYEKRNITPWIYSTSRSCIPWFYAWLWRGPSYIGRGILQKRLCLAAESS